MGLHQGYKERLLPLPRVEEAESLAMQGYELGDHQTNLTE